MTNQDFDPIAIKQFFYYVLTRHDIQMKKESGLPYPWTDDKILSENSFTCNRRIDDRTTKWLLNNITNNSELSFDDRFWRTLIFRLYNKIETAELIGLANENFWSKFDENLVLLDNYSKDPYTRAYSTRSYKYRFRQSQDKWKSSVLSYIKSLKNFYDSYPPSYIPDECLRTPKDCFDWLCKIPGIGDFLGMQLLIDIMYLPETPYNINSNLFVIAGPGAQVGIDFILKNNSKVDYESVLRYIQEHFEELCQEFYDKTFKYSKIKNDLHDLNAYCITDIQNLFCEYGKYRYMLEDRYMRKRGKYVPKEEGI